MKDFRGHELQVGDEVFVASTTETAKPFMERCVVSKILVNKADGKPRKHRAIELTGVNTGDTALMHESVVERRVGLVSRALPASEELLDRVINNIEHDILVHDTTAVAELLGFVPRQYLEGYLAED